MIKLFENWLNEKKLASIRRKLTVTVDIESTKHAQERQSSLRQEHNHIHKSLLMADETAVAIMLWIRLE